MTLESEIEIPACEFARRRGWLVRKVKWIGQRSAPDRLFSRDPEGVRFVEFKAPGKPLRPAQAPEVARMRAAGITVYVIDDLAEFKRIFR